MNFLDHNCEFCKELQNFTQSRVGRIYNSKISTRIIQESQNFFVVPTIGQILPGSLLVLPKRHYETFAEIPSNFLLEANELINQIETNYFAKGNILFEHGAKKCTSASCGVYHAHIHIVPITDDLDYKSLVGQNARMAASFEDAFKKLEEAKNYVLFRDINNAFSFNTVDDGPRQLFESQYFRKWLVQNFNPAKEWDWKKYDFIEDEVLETLT